ncbi:hypothetical protein GW17_00014853 [Ensete ventricosum]|nr:hypothetical protein GW17_00014853 [Ensete ventricosum]
MRARGAVAVARQAAAATVVNASDCSDGVEEKRQQRRWQRATMTAKIATAVANEAATAARCQRRNPNSR